jgi:secreted trypsin-like serine protease
MAALVLSPTPDAARGFTCGGTVIAPRRVLTAAHCVLGDAPSELTVLVGRQRLSESGGRTIPVAGIAVFPGYVEAQRQPLDAAIVTLAEDAGVEPVRLATAADAAAQSPGTPAWVAGWGQLEAKPTPGGTNYYADRLRELQLPVVSDEACEAAFGAGNESLTYRPRYKLCAGTGAGTSGGCYGDSGGPLAVETPAGWLQVGIVETGDACAAPGFYDIYTRVDRISAFARRSGLTQQPYPLAAPRVRGKLKAGARVRCASGRWANRPASYTYTWYRLSSGRPLAFSDVRHKVTHADAESGLTCSVLAINAGGYYEAYAAPLTP